MADDKSRAGDHPPSHEPEAAPEREPYVPPTIERFPPPREVCFGSNINPTTAAVLVS
jgi:hypothetical protein